jgi:hypothetical protein
MSTEDVAVETALLEIAKDLLQASDDMSKTHPAAAAKLAQEAYEIGRDLGIVQLRLYGKEQDVESEDVLLLPQPILRNGSVNGETNGHHVNGSNGHANGNGHRQIEDDSDLELFRILDRQRAIVPTPAEFVPSRPSNGAAPQTKPKRARWLEWMRPREWHHAN